MCQIYSTVQGLIMKVPSTRGFKTSILTFDPSWLMLDGVGRVVALEEWASKNLQPREAVMGSYSQTLDVKRPGLPGMGVGQMVVLRHRNYADGRVNVEIYLDLTTAVSGTTSVWYAKDDVLSVGYRTEYFERAEYLRAMGDNGPEWQINTIWEYIRMDPNSRNPSVRIPELFRQIWHMDNELTKWLTANVRLVPDVRPYQTGVFTQLMSTPLMLLAVEPHRRDQLLELMQSVNRPQPSEHEKHWKFYADLRERMKKKNRVASPEHYQLYERLKRSYEFVQKFRNDPLQRPISYGALLRLQKRWINAIAPLLQCYLSEAHSPKNEDLAVAS